MKHIEYWVTEDGETFDNRNKCEEYEFNLFLNRLGTHWYNEDKQPTRDLGAACFFVNERDITDEEMEAIRDYYDLDFKADKGQWKLDVKNYPYQEIWSKWNRKIMK